MSNEVPHRVLEKKGHGI